jgi:hypothetical protein
VPGLLRVISIRGPPGEVGEQGMGKEATGLVDLWSH